MNMKTAAEATNSEAWEQAKDEARGLEVEDFEYATGDVTIKVELNWRRELYSFWSFSRGRIELRMEDMEAFTAAFEEFKRRRDR